MAVIDYLTRDQDVAVTPRTVDFLSRFAMNWQGLIDILGASRPIAKAPGTALKAKRAAITLQNGSVSEGDIIPGSRATVEEISLGNITLEKYAKRVSLEAIEEKGYDAAIGMTDEAFINELQKGVCNKFYSFLATGELTSVQSTYRMGLAMAKGLVLDKWAAMNKTATEVVAFANILDVYEYLGVTDNAITVQTMFGFDYVQNYLGYRTIFLLPANLVARNKIYATPVENIVNYYVDPTNSEFVKAELAYVTDGVTNLIGFATTGDYDRATSNLYAVLGMSLFAEYIDGIANITVDTGSSIGSLTASTAAGTAAVGDSVVTISTDPVPGGKFYIKTAASTAPADPTYKAAFDATGWTAVKNGDTISTTNGHKYRLVEVNGAGQAIASATGTVTAKAS